MVWYLLQTPGLRSIVILSMWDDIALHSFIEAVTKTDCYKVMMNVQLYFYFNSKKTYVRKVY